GPGANLVGGAGAGVEASTVAVHRAVEDRLLPEQLLGAVAVVAVEVDDRDPLEPELAAQRPQRDHDVVEDAEAARAVARGVVEAAARVEGVIDLAPRDRAGAAQ